MRRHISLFLAIVSILSITGIALAQEAKKDQAPALDGYCPVAYVAMGKAVKGDPKVSLEYEGHRYLFANADARKMFKADPAKYTVAYGGWCATAAAMNQQMKSDPNLFTVKDGVTYLFSSADAKKMFDAEPAKYAYHPAYDGWCATALSMGQKTKGDPAIFTVTDGNAYLFSSADAKKMFDADAKGIIAKADAQWSKLHNS